MKNKFQLEFMFGKLYFDKRYYLHNIINKLISR